MPIHANALANYVSDMYGTVLDRAPDTGGLNGWTQALAAGAPAQTAAAGIWQSAEHLGQELTALYKTVLHRQADSAGLGGWISAMQNGMSLTAVESGFLNSAEYRLAHADNASFILAMYQDVLGRNPDAVGASRWIQNLNNGMTRAQVISSFLSSDEFYLGYLDKFYLSMLHRAADQGGELAWLQSLKNGAATLESVAEGFLASAEYMAWANSQPKS